MEWLEKKDHPRAYGRWMYRLPFEVPFFDDYGNPEGSSEWVVVSWGRDNDTNIFPCDEDGSILDFMGQVIYGLWGYWEDADTAMIAYLTDPTVRNPMTKHAKELTND